MTGKRYFRMASTLAIILAGATWQHADAAVRYVKAGAANGDGTSWESAMNDIQEAIDASAAGDEVWVAAGTYKPSRLINNTVADSRSFILKDGVSLYGGFAGTESSKDQRALKPGGNKWDMANETILNGDDDVPDTWERILTPGTSYRYSFKLTSDSDSHIPGTQNNSTHVLYQIDVIRNHTVIDGFTVTGGCADTHKTKASGGGIYAIGNVSINACRIVENSAYFVNEAYDPIYALGGGVFLNGAGQASVTNCYFARNFTTSSYTVGMGGGLYAQNANVEGCLFETCVGEDGGGAMYQSKGTLKNSTFRDCYSSSGGALYTIGGTVENIDVTDCRGLNGGGIIILDESVVTHARVWDCYADAIEFGDNLGGSGGGIYIEGGTALGCVVYNNTAFQGGGICLRKGNAVNCTVQNNSTRKGKTDVVNIDEWPESGALAGVSNCISAANVAASNFTAPTTFAGRANDNAQKAALAVADWSLAAGSEFIDAGTATAGMQEQTDMAGNPRVMGSSIDVGAYEYAATVAPNATFTFDGSNSEVVITFRTTDGAMKIVVGGDTYTVSDLTPNTTKAVAVPLNGNSTMKIHADGLSRLNIDGQGLTAIDLSNAPGLTLLQLDNNKLTQLDVSANALLTGIYASNNAIATLAGLDKCASLRVLQMHHNNLSGTIDLRGMNALSQVEVYNNALTELLLPNHSILMDVDCEYNNISSIDIAGRSALRDLAISGNKITSLDVSGCTALENLYGGENLITEIKGLADCKVIQTLNLSHNSLSDIDISVAPSITGLYLYNNELTSLDLSGNPNLNWINVNDNRIQSLDVTHLASLRLFFANNNELSEIDLSKSTICAQLQLANNKLSELDVTKLPSLYWLKADGNSLSSLDLSANKSLSLLECGNNSLTALDLSNNTTIRRVAAENNMLTSLDVSANKDLCGLSLQGNTMESAAINAMIKQLPDVSGQEPVEGSEWISILNISSMPGTAVADIAAAQAKGWRVTAEGGSGIDDIDFDSAEVVSVTYYTLSGISLGDAIPTNGCCIARIKLTDGRTVTRKYLAK